MARPRTVTDDAILEAAMTLIFRTGPDALTFAAVGKAVGLAPATLVQRYASKENLLQASMLRAWDQLDARTAELDASCAVSPEGAVAMLVAMISPGMSDEANAMGLAVLREDMRDPLLRARGATWRVALGAALGRRLTDDETDAARLGRMMASQWQGAQLWWGFERQGSPVEAIGQELRDWCAVMLRRDAGM